MYIEELRIKSSIQVFTADPANPKRKVGTAVATRLLGLISKT
jgi:hypothetical protein